MDTFDRFSIFPVYIELPLRRVADRVNESKALKQKQKSIEELRSLSQPYPTFYEEADIPHISLKPRRNSSSSICSIKLNDRTILNENGYQSFMNNLPLLNSVESVDVIREDGEPIGAEELQDLLSSVLDLIYK